MIASTSLIKIAELGLSGSVIKFTAEFYRSKNYIQLSKIIQTASISVFLGMGLFALAIFPIIIFFLPIFVPNSSVGQATEVLPYALLGIYISSVAGIFQSGLDGCNRMVARNLILIGANILYLIFSYLLIPAHGLVGLAISQILHGIVLLTACLFVLKLSIRNLPIIPLEWSVANFRLMFGYALNFQVSSLAMLLFEPATKIMMGKFSGLSGAAYYDMASQIVVKLRAILVSATQTLVPAIAGLSHEEKKNIRDLYLNIYSLVLFFSVPCFLLIPLILPAASVFWLGKVVQDIVLYGLILSFGWAVNTMALTAYFFNQGTGSMKWNTTGHVVIAGSNIAISYLMGSVFGGVGVAIGTSFALASGSIIILIRTHIVYGIKLKDIYPRDQIVLVARELLIMVMLGFSMVLFQAYSATYLIFNIVLYVLFSLILMTRHPIGKLLDRKIRGLDRK